ncbi:MAG: gliding motility-associated C-terminal domain-containing protein, partial [Flavobacteriales bacterium]|nr:gliding motility-associated C-terminal domain-containing protein [Flavobacteriales bacterium]
QATVYASGGTPSYSYQWPVSANNQTSATATGLSSGTYVVTVSDAKNCQQTHNVAVAEPSALILADTANDVLCNGDSSGFATVLVTGGTSPYTYQWPANANNQSTATATGLAAGAYVVTVTDDNGCFQTLSISINEPSALVLSYSSIDVSCSGDSSGSITLQVNGGTPAYFYSWSHSSTLSSNIATGLWAGLYHITVTDDNGCILVDSITVSEPSAMTLTTTISDVLCNGGSSGQATVNVGGGTSGYNYQWPVSAANQTTATATGLSVGVYVVTVTDANGCLATDTAVISEPAALSATYSATDVLCFGGNSGTATIVISGGFSPYQYTWPASAGNQTTQTASGLTAGTYMVLFSDSNNCGDSIQVVITEPTPLTLNMSSPSMEGCGLSNGQALGSASGGLAPYSYQWNTGSTDSLITGLQGGWYVLTVLDSNGCAHVDSVQVLIDYSVGGPISSITTTDPNCHGINDATASSVPSGGIAPYEHVWSNGDTTANIDSLSPGVYYVTITDNYGCYSLDTIQINVTPPINVNIMGDDTICYGDSTMLIASGYGSNLQFDWGNGSKNDSIWVRPYQDSIFTVYVLNGNKCTETDSIKINVIALPDVTISGEEDVCEGESVLLTAVSTTAVNYHWSNGETGQDILAFWDDPSNVYDVTVTDAHGCIGSARQPFKLNILDKPVAQFDTLSGSVFSSQIEFYDQSYSDIISWNWFFGDEDVSALQNPVHDYEVPGDYEVTLIVQNENGCFDTAYGEIKLLEDIEIPNVFTPNGDGFNDVFIIPTTGMDEFHLVIYNRWGSEMFRTEATKVSWDGMTIAGRPAPEGTYFYELKAKGEKDYSTTGTLTLIRK